MRSENFNRLVKIVQDQIEETLTLKVTLIEAEELLSAIEGVRELQDVSRRISQAVFSVQARLGWEEGHYEDD